jgi:hypothetical protein
MLAAPASRVERHRPPPQQWRVPTWPHNGAYGDVRSPAALPVPGSAQGARLTPGVGVLPSQLVAWAARAGEKRTVSALRNVYEPPLAGYRPAVHPSWPGVQVQAPSSCAPGSSLKQQGPARWNSDGAVRGASDACSSEVLYSTRSGVPEARPAGLGNLSGVSPLVRPASPEPAPLHDEGDAEPLPQSLPFRTVSRIDPLTGSVNA